MPAPRHDVLILGTVQYYGNGEIAPFLGSLAKTGFSGRVHLFVSSFRDPVMETYGLKLSSSRFRLWQLRLGTRIVPPCQGHRLSSLRSPYFSLIWLANLVGGPKFQNAAATRLRDIFVARYLLYRRHLSGLSAEDRPDVVVLSDVRDVFFQLSPDLLSSVDSLTVFLEQPGTTIADCRFNSAFVRTFAGPEGLEAIGDRPISCAGVTVAPFDLMVDYLDKMCSAILRLRREYRGMDQGIHNYLLWNDELDGVAIVPNDHGLVLTLSSGDDRHIGDDRLIRNHDGTVPAIVHQYDRLPLIAELVQSLHGLPSDI